MRRLDELAKEYGFSSVDKRVCEILGRNYDGLTFNELKRKSFSSKSLSRSLERLMELGIVARDLGFRDRGPVCVYKLTVEKPSFLWYLPVLGVGRLRYWNFGLAQFLRGAVKPLMKNRNES